MQKRIFAFLWSGALATGVAAGLLLASCFSAPIRLQPDSPFALELNQPAAATNPAVLGMSFDRLYASHSFAEMTDIADAVFVGKVTELSPVQWNQDSGEYWDEDPGDSMTRIAIRYITVEVVTPIITTNELDPAVKITSMTDSVLLDEKNNVVNQEDLAHGLQVGDQLVVFVRETELAWRGGVCPATMLMGVPYHSYFKLGDDGLYHGELIKEPLELETLIQKILDERASPANTP